jgi:hypothetical protein
MIAASISGRFTSLVSTRISFLVTSIFVSGCDPHTNFPTSSSETMIDLASIRLMLNRIALRETFQTPSYLVFALYAFFHF